MAVRLDAVGDYLSRTTDPLNYNADYTIMGWMYIVSSTAEARGIFVIAKDTTGTDRDALYIAASPTRLMSQYIIANSGVDSSGNDLGTTLTTGIWYHVCLRRSGTALEGFLNGVLDCAPLPGSVAARSAAALMYVGRFDSITPVVNGRFSHIKAWSAALTDAEVASEMRTVRPVRAADLWGWWPLVGGP